MENEIVEVNQRELQAALLNLVDLHVRKEYLSELEMADVKPMTAKQQSIIPGKNVRLLHIKKISYASQESVSDKVKNIFSALSQNGNTSMLLINGKKDCVDLYLGVADENEQNITEERKVFLSAFQTAFPGGEYGCLKMRENEELAEEFFPKDESYSVAAVSGSQIEMQRADIQADSLDSLIDAMRHKPFTAIVLSQSMRHQQLVLMRKELEDFYTNIAPLQKQDISLTENESKNYGLNFSNTITNSTSTSEGTSESTTDSMGTSDSEQTMVDHSDEQKRTARNSLIGTGLTLAATLLSASTGGASLQMSSVFQSLFFSSAIGNVLNNAGTLKKDDAPDVQTTHGTSENHSTTHGTQKTDTTSTSEGQTEGSSISEGYSSSKSCQLSYINKPVVDLLALIDSQIEELTIAEKNGAFNVGAYFIAGDEETAVTAANIYRSIVISHGSIKSTSNIYRWSDPNKTKMICEYLKRGIHPAFTFTLGEKLQYPDVTVGQPVRIEDIPAHFCIPEKTLHGINVVEHATFPRDVIFRDDAVEDTSSGLFEVGNIYHMGKMDEKTEVSIARNGLTKHLFVAGTTGAGKSNFCYHLLDSVVSDGIKVLIIEPAKGEYRQVFGGYDDFKVFGTNAAVTNLLHINPFAFPMGITVDEHIESLMGIFNNAWSMYSAMPAVLKDALVTIYREKGFDMDFQTRTGKEKFPSFADLLDALPHVIKKSEYSKEVQGNYIGALVTRVKSLTTGLYNSIFCNDEIGDCELFDENVIIDISRIRSDETKALIMGVLVNRLSEYRSCSGEMNSPLKHITLLEEAHHLLKAQTKSTAEGVNIGSASVEMISNAIAEMRTYGEGFVIADQSPASMDKSVMRNTYTKVFFNLPERDDRAVAASSLELNEEQHAELARIPTGVAVVYHRAWAEPVLAKIKYFSKDKMKPYVHSQRDIIEENKSIFGQALAVLLYCRIKEAEKNSTYDPEEIESIISKEYSWLGDRESVLKGIFSGKDELLKSKTAASDILSIYNLFFDFTCQLKEYGALSGMDKWLKKINADIQGKTNLSYDEISELVGLLMIATKNTNSNTLKWYGEYKTNLNKK